MDAPTEMLLAMQQRINHYQNKPGTDTEKAACLNKALGLIEAMAIVQELSKSPDPDFRQALRKVEQLYS